MDNQPIGLIISEDQKMILHKNKYVNQIIYKYNKANYTKYSHYEMLAIDKSCGDGKKLYVGFKTKSDKSKFILSHKYNNIYEIVTKNEVKPYFDIDYKIATQYKTEKQVTDILNRMIIEFNTNFNVAITSDNVYCYVKFDGEGSQKSQLIKSIHIVISGFKVTKQLLKEFVDGINKQRDADSFKKMIGGLDGKVYSPRNLFSLPHQRKLGGTEYFKWFYCFDNDTIKYDDETAIRHYLINDTNGCLDLSWGLGAPTTQTPLANQIITEPNTSEASDEETQNSQSHPIQLNPQNIVSKLKEHLPQAAYECALWIGVTRQIVLNRWDGWSEWVDYSAERSISYDVAQNKEWVAGLDDKFATTNITKHLNKINEEYDLYFIWDKTSCYTEELITWISKVTKINCNELTATIKRHNETEANAERAKKKKKKKQSQNIIIIGNNYIFNISKQTLVNELTQTFNHFGMDTKFNNQYGIDESEFKTISQSDIINEMNSFLLSSHRLAGFKMIWATGKTYYGVKTIKNFAIEHKKRILIFSPNSNLNIETQRSLGGISHLDIIDKSKKITRQQVRDASIVTTSFESLKTTLLYNGDVPFHILVFDEYESDIQQFISDTFKKVSSSQISELVRTLVRNADKIVCLDCDLSQTRMNVINNILINDDNDNRPIQLYNCNYNSWANYKYIIHTNNNDMRRSFTSDIFDGNKRVLYATNSKTEALAIYNLVVDTIKQNVKNGEQSEDDLSSLRKNVLVISSNGVVYYVDGVEYTHTLMTKWAKELKNSVIKDEIVGLKKKLDIGKYAEKSKTKFFQMVEGSLLELRIDVLVYSPSMSCGISFGNSKTDFMFDKLYSYASVGSVPAREFNQMIHRCRNLKDREINIHIKSGFKPVTTLITTEQAEVLVKNHRQLKFYDVTASNTDKKENKWWEDIEIDKFSDSTFYKDIVVSDVREKINSEKNYTQELIGRLMINHSLNVSVKHLFNSASQLIGDDYNLIKKRITLDTRMLLQREMKVSFNDYNQLTDESNENDGVDNRHKLNKYYTLTCMNVNKSNNEYLIEDANLDAEKQSDCGVMSETNGIFQNYAIDGDNEVCFYTGYSVNKYFIQDDAISQDGYWCVYVKKTGEFVIKLWKLKTELVGEISGLFKYHKIDTAGEIYYYGGKHSTQLHTLTNQIISTPNTSESTTELSDDEQDELSAKPDKLPTAKYGMDDIYYEAYDKDKLIQYSKKLALIYGSPYIDRLNKLNKTISKKSINITNNDDDIEDVTMRDMYNNKLAVVKGIMDMLGININELINERKIYTNGALKLIFDNNKLFIKKGLLWYYTTMDMNSVGTPNIITNEYTSEKLVYFKFIKDIVTSYLHCVKITHSHHNINGERGYGVYDNDECFVVFQYENYGNNTFINTYYEPLKNEIHEHSTRNSILIPYIVGEKYLNDNMTAKKQYGRKDKLFETRRGAIYMRNRHILLNVDDCEINKRIPFNILTAATIIDNHRNGKKRKRTRKLEVTQDNIISLVGKSAKERIEKYLEIETGVVLDFDETDLNKISSDIRYYKYTDICWDNNDGNYKKKLAIKYTPDKHKESAELIVTETPRTTQAIVSNYVNELFEFVANRSAFKNMVNSEINIGGETELITTQYNKFLIDEIDTLVENSNDNFFNVMRPSIKIVV